MFKTTPLLPFLCAVVTLGACSPGIAAPPKPLHISVDASDLGSRRVSVEMTLPVQAGELKLVYPGFLPGAHSAAGPLENVARIQISAGDKPLAWHRDAYNVYVLHAQVPKGISTVTVAYDYVFTPSGDEVFYGVAASQSLAVINPASFALAPEGNPAAMPVSLDVRIPHEWSASSAMTMTSRANSQDGDVLQFAPTTLYTMIDSPIMAGQFHQAIPIPHASGDVPHTLELYADSADDLQKQAALTPLVTRLVAESGKLFGVRHYPDFHFLVALTSRIPRNGLEHHASVAYVFDPNDFDRAAQRLGVKLPSPPQAGNASPRPASFAFDQWTMNLLPHEFVHSWNGKYRRPYGEQFQMNTAPQSADLVWMYEGLTEYLGELLMVRSGFATPMDWRNTLRAGALAQMENSNRKWETIADAALVLPYTYIHGPGTSLRPVNDVYYASRMVWLEADAIIRQRSSGKRSLDDFCRIFFGGANHGAEMKPYTRTDIVHALIQTEPYDWESFLNARFYTPQTEPTIPGLTTSGWEIQYIEAPSEFATEAESNYRYSLGFTVGTDGIVYVYPDSLAAKAGVKSGMTLLGVNGYKFTRAKLREQVRQTGASGAKNTVELLLTDSERYYTIRLNGVTGEKFPVLVHRTDKPDLLTDITKPLDAPLPAPPTTL